MDRAPEAEMEDRIQAILSCLDIMSAATRSSILTRYMESELHPAISVLGSTLDKARPALWLRTSVDPKVYSSRNKRHQSEYFLFGQNPLLRARMLANG